MEKGHAHQQVNALSNSEQAVYMGSMARSPPEFKLGRPGSRTGGRMRLCGLGGRAESGQFGIGNWRFCGGFEIS